MTAVSKDWEIVRHEQYEFMEKLLDGVEVEWMAVGGLAIPYQRHKDYSGKIKVLHKDGARIEDFSRCRLLRLSILKIYLQ